MSNPNRPLPVYLNIGYRSDFIAVWYFLECEDSGLNLQSTVLSLGKKCGINDAGLITDSFDIELMSST
jgi:hypothetical protein